MPWAHPDVLDNGLGHLRANAAKLMLVSAYSNGDSYAAVNASKLLETALKPEDWTAANGANGARQVTSPAGRTVSATGSAAGPVSPATKINLFWVFTDGVSKVLWVTNATSEQAIVPGTVYAIPPLTYSSGQPTSV